jgi:GTP-binding protein
MQKIFKNIGLDQALREKGAKAGDVIQIEGIEFDYSE